MTQHTAALQLTSRFAYAPNSKGYCGKDSAPAKFIRCITQKECEGIEDEITKFIALHPYLKTISQILNKPLCAYDVVESYWIGNDELKKAKLDDYQILLDNFKAQGIPDFLYEELTNRWPKAFIPHHLFQIIHVGVGRASGSVPYTLESMNNCMIRWGQIEKIHDQTVTATIQSLDSVGGKLIRSPKKITVGIDNNFTPELKTGDTIAIHWNHVAKVLTQRETDNLEYWTDTILTLLQQ